MSCSLVSRTSQSAQITARQVCAGVGKKSAVRQGARSAVGTEAAAEIRVLPLLASSTRLFASVVAHHFALGHHWRTAVPASLRAGRNVSLPTRRENHTVGRQCQPAGRSRRLRLCRGNRGNRRFSPVSCGRKSALLASYCHGDRNGHRVDRRVRRVALTPSKGFRVKRRSRNGSAATSRWCSGLVYGC